MPERPESGADRERELDSRLAHAARRGDAKSLATLIERHQSRVFRMCLRVTGNEEAAAEATQDALLRAVRAIATFDERAQFSTWITRIAINACFSRARSEKLRRHASLDASIHSSRPSAAGPAGDTQTFADSLPGREQTSHSSVEKTEEQHRLLGALAQLDFEARTILVLRDGHDLEYEQIASMLGIAIGTVKSRLFRARVALRELMEESGDRATDQATDQAGDRP